MAVVMKTDEAKAAILRGEAPDGLTVEGYLSFGSRWDSQPEVRLTHLPDDLTVETLEITYCPNFRVWPIGLHCKTLRVHYCPVSNLLGDIVVENKLFLEGCDAITDLPVLSLRELSFGDYLASGGSPMV